MRDTTPALQLAHIIDPEAFEHHEIEERRKVAALQWSARRHIAHEHAVRVLESDWLAARDARIREEALGVVVDGETPDDLTKWLDSVLSTLAVEAKSVTTPEQAFHLAIRAVHAVRRINFAVDTGYYGAFKSRMAIEKVSGIHLGDYPERAIIDVIDTPAQADGGESGGTSRD